MRTRRYRKGGGDEPGMFDDFTKGITDMTNTVSEQIGKAKDAATQGLNQAQQTATQGLNQVQEAATQGLNQVQATASRGINGFSPGSNTAQTQPPVGGKRRKTKRKRAKRRSRR